ncbi:MAG TPA: YqgE/AlgH family protein [Caulobacteraceae bacterium]|nr:YqgE/AlgH family protein [Caulobacteraceae bacterium]
MPFSTSVPEFLTGRLLVAMPGIDDPRFERAVLYICDHSDEHAMGLAVNRPVDGLTVPDLLERLGVKSEIRLPPELVLLGGPVERERGFVLHTDDYQNDASIQVGEGVALTATREALNALASRQRPRKSLLALGYAGWGPGQLEREVRDNVWLVCDPDEALLFGDDHDHKWSRALERIGVDAAWLSGTAGRA